MSDEKKEKPETGTPEQPSDDDRVIADMNVEGMPWYRKNSQQQKKKQKKDPFRPTAKETRAMIFAAYQAYLPYLLIVLGVMAAVYVIGYFYFK